jgi:nucleoside-diphosphate-sugar epimerase
MDSKLKVSGTPKSTVLVTGVTGFIGGFLARYLASEGYKVIGSARSRARVPHATLKVCDEVRELRIDENTDWSECLQSVDFVIHTAAHVHIRRPSKTDFDRFRVVNIQGTRLLAEGCREHPIKLLINLSSVAADIAQDLAQSDGYGVSKLLAEEVIADQLLGSDCRYINLRLPAVYGPGMRGGLALLFKLVKLGIPLPSVSRSEKRSYLGLWNLADCVAHCLRHLPTQSCTVGIADSGAVDLSELIGLMANVVGRRPILVPVGEAGLRLGGWLSGRGREIKQALTGHVVDPSLAAARLGWVPTMTASQCWERCV